jgi:hypothetical protein
LELRCQGRRGPSYLCASAARSNDRSKLWSGR